MIIERRMTKNPVTIYPEASVVVFNKNKTNSDIVFVDDENGLERTVKITEIQENDYCLSVQNYVQKEEIKEKINPLELMKETRNIFYNHYERKVEYQKRLEEGTEASENSATEN